MASVPLNQASAAPPGPSLLTCVRDHGSLSHPYLACAELRSGPQAGRNLADAVHLLCALHGRHPGVVEAVANRNVEAGARTWLNHASEGFARERAFLTKLAVAAGPLPATPGKGSEAALVMQRNAILTLANSERRGCAIGAAIAVAADWVTIRIVLNAAAERFGVDAPPAWRGAEGAAEVANGVGSDGPARRALMFGAEQVALQHRGLWDLLRARAEARIA